MKKVFVLTILIFLIIKGYGEDASSDLDLFSKIDNILNDDTLRDLSDDNLTEKIDKNKVDENKKINILKVSLICEVRDIFSYNLVRDTLLNENNLFDIDSHKNTIYVDLKGKLAFREVFQFYVDTSFRFVSSGNELLYLKSDTHEDKNNRYLDNIVRELYFMWTIPIKYPIKIIFGRAYYDLGKSYIFNIFNHLDYERKNVLGFIDYDDYGPNILKFSLFFPYINFDIVYSPGIPNENEYTKFFNIQREQKILTSLNFSVPYVDFGFNGYFDTSFQNNSFGWALGTTFSANVNNDIVIYGDFLLNGNGQYKRFVKKDDFLFGDMAKYEWQTNYKIGFVGEIGINYTPNSLFNIISELYVNTYGLTPKEQKEMTTNFKEVKKNYQNPEVPTLDFLDIFKNHYKGVMGDSLHTFDPFDLGMFYFFTKFGKDNIASSGVDLSISTLTHLFDGSTMVIPKVSYTFLKYFTVDFSCELYLGYEGSLFGEIPFLGTLSTMFEIKL